ncbi:anthrone oxygenase family protein [uncultured Leifsonia sp.]|uniref:anthrone oxygenase family protein n=1 Tax=uncultured Leifsonia sp. TaxID=340359 RepID=UPI0025FE0D83|nr:anthrone oxygenase family protein [uncultured Leifsonia sp.]
MQTATAIWIILAALSTAVVGGVYLGFSVLVMPALDGDARPTGVMKRINALAPRSPFMLAFTVSALSCGTSIVLVLLDLITGAVAAWAAVIGVAGAVLGLAGFVITAAINVPLNNRLAEAAANDEAAFAAFQRPWRRANSTRGAASLAGAAALLTSLLS